MSSSSAGAEAHCLRALIGLAEDRYAMGVTYGHRGATAHTHKTISAPEDQTPLLASAALLWSIDIYVGRTFMHIKFLNKILKKI